MKLDFKVFLVFVAAVVVGSILVHFLVREKVDIMGTVHKSVAGAPNVSPAANLAQASNTANPPQQ